MMSCKISKISLIAFLLLATSSAFAQGRNDPAAYRLITSDGEDDASPSALQSVPMPRATGGNGSFYNGFGSSYNGFDGSYNDCGNGCYNGCDNGCHNDQCNSCYCPRWTATADFIVLDRIGTKSQTLVRQVIMDDFVSGAPQRSTATIFTKVFTADRE